MQNAMNRAVYLYVFLYISNFGFAGTNDLVVV